MRHDGGVTDAAVTNLVSSPALVGAEAEDLMINMAGVSVVRDGRTILAPLDWQVELDERWIIIGPNGAGKTTLMQLASAQMFPSTGTVDLVGERMGRVDLRDIRTAIGMTSSAVAHRVPGDEVVEDIVISAGYDVMGRWREEYDELDREQAANTLEKIGAYHLMGRRWATLSEGERKRTLIARALMTDPELLLLDEPGAGLDLGGREELIALLNDLAEDPDAPAIVMITHHVEEIPPGFTHALVLSEGKAVAQGLLEEVLTDETLTAAFGQPISVRRDADSGRWVARGAARPKGRHQAQR